MKDAPLELPKVQFLDAIAQEWEKIPADLFWAFVGQKTSHGTHGYHRYPAKFVPQLAARLIADYAPSKGVVLDPFMGCGTTMMEAKSAGIPSVGGDINSLAVLITRAKVTSIEPRFLEDQWRVLLNKLLLSELSQESHASPPGHARLEHWFRPHERAQLSLIHHAIAAMSDDAVRIFFQCGFSNILKGCSVWMQRSNKPTRDPSKVPREPFNAFRQQVKRMLRGNADCYEILQQNGRLDVPCEVHCCDARELPLAEESVGLVVTSPPYVTSYEYADLHQLTVLWFGYTEDLREFRTRFIGTTQRSQDVTNKELTITLGSSLAEEISEKLAAKSGSLARGVAGYFAEMHQVWREMHRVLRRGGRAAIVIGDTRLRGVPVLNAAVFLEQLQREGFQCENIIKRTVPSKSLPSTRDPSSGRFVRASHTGHTLAYPTEYILIMRKP